MEFADVQIPAYFLCPISLQIMRDPVTLATGITYDRENIEQWLFSGNHRSSCPATNQPLLETSDLTPNHTLRRLIQSWCASHASRGVERFPTPRPPVDKSQIAAILDDLLPASALTKLRKIVADSERNKRCVESAAGALDFLASVVSNPHLPSESGEALSILYSLHLSEIGIRRLLDRDPDFLNSISSVLRISDNYESRVHAVLLAKKLVGVISDSDLAAIRPDFFEEIVRVLRDRISYQAMKAALQVLYAICPSGRNTAKAVKAGGVTVLIDLLLDEPEKRASEMMMVVLDELCGCPEGRAEVIAHAAGLPMVAKKMIRVSAVATERAVRIVHALSSHLGTPAVLEEMLQVGVVSKLCLLLQADCAKNTRKMVKEILRMHLNVWKRSPCLTPRIKALYLCS